MKKQIVINDTEYRNQLADAESEFADERACKFFIWFQSIPNNSKVWNLISAHESETSEWAERIDSLNAEKSRLASENAQLLADKDGLLLKLSELESEMARINARLDNVVEESATKTDNYIEQIKENRSKFYFHQKWTFRGCIIEKLFLWSTDSLYRFSPCIWDLKYFLVRTLSFV